MLSVVIITLNEEQNLSRCLQSLPEGSEVFILDSNSSDRTVDIAKSFGATVEQRVFDNYASQKNAAIALASTPWVLCLDADEELDDTSRLDIEQIITSKTEFTAFQLPRQLVFLGKKMRFGKTNDAPIRLFKNGKATFENAVHEVLRVDGRIGCVRGQLLHYSYHDLQDYFTRFNRYTSRVAANHHSKGKKAPAKLVMAMRFWWEFVSRYLVRLGFIDGYPGYVYALISSLYVFTKYEKLRELDG